jgi:hypothetical protein
METEMSRSAYGKQKCYVCGEEISTAGFAQFNHKMMHVREGTMSVTWIEPIDGSRPYRIYTPKKQLVE